MSDEVEVQPNWANLEGIPADQHPSTYYIVNLLLQSCAVKVSNVVPYVNFLLGRAFKEVEEVKKENLDQ